MRFATPRLRAAACAGMAVATLLTVTPSAFAAPAAPAASVPDLIPALITSPPDLPVDLLPSAALAPVFDLLSSPTLLLPGAADLTSVPQATTGSAASRVIALAKSHLGARYVHGAVGPRVFDCIGLVLRAYADAGVVSKMGGWASSSGYSVLAWGRRHHLVSTANGQPGDIVVWGGGGHVGIYLGHGMAISALVSGVRIHGIYAVTKRFTAFIHTGVSGTTVAAPKSRRTVSTTSKTKSIGIRHARPSLVLRTGHATDARRISTLKAGTKLTLVSIWHDPKGRTWYRANANSHVGWVAGWLTRA